MYLPTSSGLLKLSAAFELTEHIPSQHRKECRTWLPCLMRAIYFDSFLNSHPRVVSLPTCYRLNYSHLTMTELEAERRGVGTRVKDSNAVIFLVLSYKSQVFKTEFVLSLDFVTFCSLLYSL